MNRRTETEGGSEARIGGGKIQLITKLIMIIVMIIFDLIVLLFREYFPIPQGYKNRFCQPGILIIRVGDDYFEAVTNYPGAITSVRVATTLAPPPPFFLSCHFHVTSFCRFMYYSPPALALRPSIHPVSDQSR